MTHDQHIDEYEDISAEIGPLFPDPEATVTMYSYSSPAWSFWQGAFDELRARGWSREQAFEFLQSKHTRWMFDGDSAEVCWFMGKIMTREYPIANKMKVGKI